MLALALTSTAVPLPASGLPDRPPVASASSVATSAAAPVAARRVGRTTALLRVRPVVSSDGPAAAKVVVKGPRTHRAGRVVVRSSTGEVLARGVAPRGRRTVTRVALPALTPGEHRLHAVFRAAGRRVDRSPVRRVVARRGCVGPRCEARTTTGSAGVPEGTELTPSGSLTITRPGTVVDGLDISGTLTIAASDVTVRNTRVRGDAFWIVTIKEGVTGVVISDSEVDGLGLAGTDGSSGVVGGSARLVRVEVTGVENGFVPGSGTTITDSHVHHLASGGAPHYDGVQIDGGVSAITMTGSTIDLSDHTQTAAVMVDNYFGPVDDVTIAGNLLLGGGFTVYADASFSASDPLTDVTYADNRMGKGYYGYGRITRGAGVTWTGNVDHTTGKPVSPGG